MINPGQFVLELILVVAALVLSRSVAGTQHRRFVIVFAALAAAINCAFYYFAVGPLYLARGFDRSVLAGAVTFETVRWGVLAFVLSRLATRLQDIGVTSGFTLRQNPDSAGSVLGIGIAVGVVVTATLYSLSFVEYYVSQLALPWTPATASVSLGRGPLTGWELDEARTVQDRAAFAARRSHMHLRWGGVVHSGAAEVRAPCARCVSQHPLRGHR